MNKKTGLIERLRAKPLAHRRMIAFILSAGITFVVVVVWFISTFTGFSTADNGSAEKTENLSAFSLIKDQFSGAFKDNSFEDSNLAPPDYFEGNDAGAISNTDAPAYVATSSEDEQATITR